jgi:hypothetical protein
MSAAQEGAGGATSPFPDSGDDGPAQPIRPGRLSQNSDGPAGARTCLTHSLSMSRRTLPGSGHCGARTRCQQPLSRAHRRPAAIVGPSAGWARRTRAEPAALRLSSSLRRGARGAAPHAMPVRQRFGCENLAMASALTSPIQPPTAVVSRRSRRSGSERDRVKTCPAAVPAGAAGTFPTLLHLIYLFYIESTTSELR